MTSAEIWAIIAGGTLVTYATRLSFIVFIPTDRLPARVQRGLRYTPPAVLAAIILPSLLLPTGAAPAALLQPRLLAGLAAGLIAGRTRNTWLTIAGGMGSMWALRALGLGA